MRILPRAQREAMFEIYSFCRAVDDIADDFGPREGRRQQLAQWRSDIDAVYRGAPPPALAGLAQAAAAARDWRRPCVGSTCNAKISSPSSTAWRWM
jgi:phytoene/squalene synthetase